MAKQDKSKKKAAPKKSKAKKTSAKKRAKRKQHPKGKAAPKKKASKKKPQSRKPKGLNFNSMRALIWRAHRDKYEGKDYNDKDGQFLRVVKEVWNDCKSHGADCTDAIVLEKYDEISSDEKRPYPYIADDLYEETHPFWEIKDVEFALFAPYLWVVSRMIMPDPAEFKITQYVPSDGDTSRGYNKYFKEWVDWCNMIYRDSYGVEFDSDVVEVHFIFTKPEYKKKKKRWETEILIVTPQGSVDDFGFTPQGRGSEHTPEEHTPPKPSEKAKVVELPAKEGEAPKIEEVEIVERKKKGQMERLVIAKTAQIEEVKMWKMIEEEGEMKKAITKLKQINKQIDDLLR